MAEKVYQTWERLTGLPWKQARALGYSDGAYGTNIALQKKLLSGWRPSQSKKKAPAKKSAPSKPSTPQKSEKDIMADEYARESEIYNQNIRDYDKYAGGWKNIFEGYTPSNDPLSNYTDDLIGENANKYGGMMNEFAGNQFLDPYAQQKIDDDNEIEMDPESILKKYLKEVPQTGDPKAMAAEQQKRVKAMQANLKSLMDAGINATPGTSPTEIVNTAYDAGVTPEATAKFNISDRLNGTTLIADNFEDGTSERVTVGDEPTPEPVPTEYASDIQGVGLDYLKTLYEGAGQDYAKRTREAQAYARQLLGDWQDSSQAYNQAYDQQMAQRANSGLRGGVSNRNLNEMATSAQGMLNNIAATDQDWRTNWLNRNKVENIKHANDRRGRDLDAEYQRITDVSPITNTDLKSKWQQYVGVI